MSQMSDRAPEGYHQRGYLYAQKLQRAARTSAETEAEEAARELLAQQINRGRWPVPGLGTLLILAAVFFLLIFLLAGGASILFPLQ